MIAVPVGLIGDYSPSVVAHRAIPEALRLAAGRLGHAVETTWLHTASLGEDVSDQLGHFAALWCVPGSPYANEHAALFRHPLRPRVRAAVPGDLRRVSACPDGVRAQRPRPRGRRACRDLPRRTHAAPLAAVLLARGTGWGRRGPRGLKGALHP